MRLATLRIVSSGRTLTTVVVMSSFTRAPARTAAPFLPPASRSESTPTSLESFITTRWWIPLCLITSQASAADAVGFTV